MRCDWLVTSSLQSDLFSHTGSGLKYLKPGLSPQHFRAIVARRIIRIFRIFLREMFGANEIEGEIREEKSLDHSSGVTNGGETRIQFGILNAEENVTISWCF